MKKYIQFAVLVLLVLTVRLTAATLTDNFDNGIHSNLWTEYQWQGTTSSGYIVPVQVSAPDESGRLKISKNLETTNTGLNSSFEFGINSSFMLQGNFTMSIDFNLLNFPQSNPAGVIDAVLAVRLSNGGFFSCYRVADALGGQLAGVAGGGSEGWGQISDFHNEGKFGITRVGNTFQGWIDNGAGAITLGSITADWAAADAQVSLFISEYTNGLRSSQAMDVRFDNFYVLADAVIVPEPMSMFLLSLGGLMLRIRKK